MFSKRLKESRKSAGLTQEELAIRIGVERSSVGKYESTSTIPSPDVLIKIATELNVTTDYLLTGKVADGIINGISIRLKELRIQRGLYQKDIAAKLGVDRTTYVKYENGSSEPNHEMLQKLADIFETTTDYLLGRTDEIAPVPIGASNDETLMFALWGNDNKDITPEMIADVRKFAQFIRETKKDEANDNN